MIYHIETYYYNQESILNASGKGRDDYFEMLRRCGSKGIVIKTLNPHSGKVLLDRIMFEKELYIQWRTCLKDLNKDDILFIHTPASKKFIGMHSILKNAKRRGCKIVTIVFDLEEFMLPFYDNCAKLKNVLSRRLEKELFFLADVMMVHNSCMKDYAVSMGIDPEIVIPVGTMDYLKEGELNTDDIRSRTGKDKPVLFCGNLASGKAGFLMNVPSDLHIDLYGDGLIGPIPDNLNHIGAYSPMELMDVINGSFGLVWDGDSADTCSGTSGKYMKYNNPHKMALYLASGFPVIVWDKSAMADFVLSENCGIAVSRLSDIRMNVDGMSDDQYSEMADNAIRVGAELRKGVHLKAAIEKAIHKAASIE